MFHPSLLLLFLDGHFQTTPHYDLTDFDIHDFLPNSHHLKAKVKRTPPEDELFGYLAKFLPPTFPSAAKATKSIVCEVDASHCRTNVSADMDDMFMKWWATSKRDKPSTANKDVT